MSKLAFASALMFLSIAVFAEDAAKPKDDCDCCDYQGQSEAPAEAQARLEWKLKNVILPGSAFLDKLADDAKSVEDYFKLLAKASEKYDPDREGVEIVLNLPEAEKAKDWPFPKRGVDENGMPIEKVQVTDIPLRESLSYACARLGFEFKACKGKIFVSSKGKDGK